MKESDEDMRNDWLILRRNFSDTVSPTTMNVAEGFERLIKALWRFFHLEQTSAPFTPMIEFKIDEGTSIFLYRVAIEYPTTMKLMFDQVEKSLRAINEGPFHSSIELALEYTFNGISAVLQQDRELFAKDISDQEATLAGLKQGLREVDQNISQMGRFDLAQQSLPIPEAVSK